MQSRKLLHRLVDSKCYTTNFLVSPGGNSGSHPIYSNRQEGNKILGSTVQSTASSYGNPTFLTRGLTIFNYYASSCCTLHDTNPAYFLFDFGSEMLVQKVVIGKPNYNVGDASTRVKLSQDVGRKFYFS